MPTVIPGGVLTLEEARRACGLNDTNGSRDDDLKLWVVGATQMIESETGPIAAETIERRFHGGKIGVALPFPIVDEDAVTEVTEDETATTDFWVDPRSRIVYAGGRGAPRRFAPGKRNVKVTVAIGYAETPALLKLAARTIVRVWFQQESQGPAPAFDAGGDSYSETVTTPKGFAWPRKAWEQVQAWISAGGLA